MLWLKAWLQESAIKGPRCMDGGLVREMRLSKQECSQVTPGGDPVAPGCEAELLTAPGIGPPFMSLKDATTNTSKNLPPLPQESDYFYDEYIDYPYNETAVQEKEKLALKVINDSAAATTTTKKPGNTPTLYAAPNKNKTKTQVTNSPSSSGFTFFGVPLPSLNALLGTTGRKNDVTPPMTAQRKSAIVNVNARGGVFPPVMPEIQTGGFVPIVPGMDGGFKPMMAPPTVSSESVHREVQTVFNHSEPLLGGGNTKRQYDVNSTKSETVYEIRASDTVEKVTKKSDFEDTTQVNVAASALPDSEINHKSIEMHNFTETENFEDIFKETIDLPYSTTSSYEQAVLIEEMMEENFTSSNNKKHEATTTTTTTEAPKENVVVEQVLKKQENNTATPLTSLLIPGGQQQRFKPPVGRSTITKVVSPHAPPLSSSLKITDALLEKDEIITEANSVLDKENQDTSWYFTNYNKTNVQPFVGQSLFKSDGSHLKSIGVTLCLMLSILCCL